MITDTLSPAEREIIYPEDDGNPLSDNTRQFRYIVTIEGGLEALFRNDSSVFVAGNLLWYPVKGDPDTRCAPDAMVVFGRPKGERRSYRQWEEDGIASQVVFEVLSPGNRLPEMIRKFRFYEHYGVEEYYVYDPDEGELDGWLRDGEALQEIPEMLGWVSPRLGVRFELEGLDLRLTGPDGRPFATYTELAVQRDALAQQRDTFAQQFDTERERAERLSARLRELGVDPDAG